MNLIIKRYAIVLVVLSIYATSGMSQMRLGIRAGVNSTRIKTNDFHNDKYKIVFTGGARTGFHAGIVTQLEIGNVFLQPELLFSSIRNDIRIDNLLSGDEDLTELELNKIDIPLMIGYKWDVFKIQAGPVASVLIKDKSQLTDITGYDLLMKKATVGFQAGIGFDVSKLAFDLKYEGSLSKLDDGITIGDEKFEFDARSSQLIFSIGLFF